LIFNRFKSARIRVAGVFIRDGRILLIAHKKNGKVYWLLPGGGVNFGESLTEALARELKEELGLDVSVGDIALISDSIAPRQQRHIVNICFFFKFKKGRPVLGKERRLHDFGFFTEREIASLVVFPPIANELKRLLAGGRGPRTYLGSKWMEW